MAEQAQIIELSGRGLTATAIAKRLARPLQSVSAKVVSLRRAGAIAPARSDGRLHAAPCFSATAASVPLPALAPGGCVWPLGDPLEDGFGYCGTPRERGRPYCPGHAALAYVRKPR